MRNLHIAVSAKHAPAATAAAKTIFAHTDLEEVVGQWDWVADTLPTARRHQPSIPVSFALRPNRVSG